MTIAHPLAARGLSAVAELRGARHGAPTAE
jgi:hypothetical protein